MEKYIFDYGDHNENIKRFNDKLVKDKYVIRKITIYFDYEIEKVKNLIIQYNFDYLNLFENSFEFYNNKLSIACDFEYKECHILYGFYICLNNETNSYKSLEVEICKPKIHINKLKSKTNIPHSWVCVPWTLPRIIITSNYFTSLNELIKYIIDVSGMNYEQSKKYVLSNEGEYIYYNGIYNYHEINDDLIEIYNCEIKENMDF